MHPLVRMYICSAHYSCKTHYSKPITHALLNHALNGLLYSRLRQQNPVNIVLDKSTYILFSNNNTHVLRHNANAEENTVSCCWKHKAATDNDEKHQEWSGSNRKQFLGSKLAGTMCTHTRTSVASMYFTLQMYRQYEQVFVKLPFTFVSFAYVCYFRLSKLRIITRIWILQKPERLCVKINRNIPLSPLPVKIYTGNLPPISTLFKCAHTTPL